MPIAASPTPAHCRPVTVSTPPRRRNRRRERKPRREEQRRGKSRGSVEPEDEAELVEGEAEQARQGKSEGGGAMTVSDSTSSTEHELLVSGLSPATRYPYTVGSSTMVLAEGADFAFTTAHTARTSPRSRIPGRRELASTSCTAESVVVMIDPPGLPIP
jgi:hypothetical protein